MQLSALSNEERRIYDLVVRRFLAVLLPPCVYEETVIQASIEKECFTARGKRMVEKGWQEAYEDNRYDEEDEAKEEVREQNLPLLEAGMKIGSRRSVSAKERQNLRHASRKARCSPRWKIRSATWKTATAAW